MKRTYYVLFSSFKSGYETQSWVITVTPFDLDSQKGLLDYINGLQESEGTQDVLVRYWKELKSEQSLSVQLAVQQLNEIVGGDFEAAHSKADGILLSFLQAAGYTEVVHAYNEARDRCEFQYA